MKKNFLLFTILSLFLIIFNLLFFLFGNIENNHNSSWISYGFIHFSYMIFVLSIFTNKKSSGRNGYEASTVFITWKYFVIELIVGVVFIFLNLEGIAIALCSQLIIAAIFIILWLSNLLANEHTADSMAKQEQEISYIKNCSYKLRLLSQNSFDLSTRKIIDKCYDAVSSSPSKSNINVYDIEVNILNTISELENAVFTDNKESIKTISTKILKMVAERNIKLKNQQ